MPVVFDESALFSGSYWGGIEVTGRPVFVTYSFPVASPASHADPGAMGGAAGTFQALDAADQAVARAALAAWADVCGLTLLEVAPGQGDIQFGWYDFSGTVWDGADGIAFYPFGDWNGGTFPWFFDHRTAFDASGDVFLNLDGAPGGTADFGLLLHEIGHALGLKHPFEVVASVVDLHDEVLDASLDTTAQTVMSYTGAPPTALGPLDIAAVRAIYGLADAPDEAWDWNANRQRLTQTGTAAGDTLIGISVRDTMEGRGGHDRLFGLDDADVLNGGGGDDTLHGGSGKDKLSGGEGADWLEGGDGADRLTGGAGNDYLIGGAGKDRFIFADGFGWDGIADFADGQDTLQFNGLPGIARAADLAITDDGFGNAIVVAGASGTLTVFGVAAAALTDADMVF
jgi:hypothetical protein